MPLSGELRIGTVAVEMEIPELGFAVEIGEIEVTECETVNQFKGSKTEPPQFTRGYGLVFGQTERKAIAMALVDRALRWKELGEDYRRRPGAGRGIRAVHATTSRRPGFSSISSCRTTSISRPSWNWSGTCGAEAIKSGETATEDAAE